ncbi:hypothetical protein GCM10027521_42780 [Amycolatopsis cihanbeyliensis]
MHLTGPYLQFDPVERAHPGERLHDAPHPQQRPIGLCDTLIIARRVQTYIHLALTSSGAMQK